MKRFIRQSLILISSLFIATAANAEQFKTIKDIDVHYSAFNSTFLTPTVAREFGLKRNGFNAVINISVLDRYQVGKPSTTATVTGTAKNLIGQSKTLEFTEVKQGDAIYYLAQFPISNEEQFSFKIDINAGLKGAGKIEFIQKFYTSE